MQNTPLLALLRPIFALKRKIAPPPLPLALAMRNGQRPEVTSTRKLWASTWLKTFFFLKSPTFGQKNRLNLSEDRSKSGSRSLMLLPVSKTAPSPLQIPVCAPDIYYKVK